MATGDEDYSGDYTDSGESDYGDDLSRYSQEAQDYIRDNARTRINGKLLGDDGKNKAGFGKFGQKKDKDTGKKKWGLLNKGEEDASKAPNKNGKGGDKNASLAEKENNVEADDQSAVGKYKNAVKGVEDIKKGRFIRGSGRLKKSGPIFAVLAICLGFGGAGFLGQMSMTSSFMAQIQETFDSTLVPQQLRSKVFLRYQTSKTGKKCIKAHYLRDDEFKISKRMANKFTKQGIDIVEEGGVKVMKYTGDDGNTRTVVADRNQAGNGKVYIDDAIDNDPSFRKKYNMSTAPWRTSVALWFDSGVQRVLSFFNIKSRNSHKEYDADSSDAKEKLRNTLTDSAEQDSVGAKVKSTEVEDETKVVSTESGTEERTTPKRPSTETEGTITKADASQPATIKSKLKGVLDGAISKSSMLVNFYCAVADGIGVITAIVAAAQTIQIVNMASSIFEGIQKAQAGEGDSSPIHEIGNALTERTENTYTEATAFKDDYEVEESKNNTVTLTRSSIESN